MRTAMRGEKGKKKPETKKPKHETLPARREDKQNNKLSAGAIQAIIDLTLQGVAVATIREFILETFKVSISDTTVFDYRRKHRDKMLASIEDDIAAARAMYPDSALLVGRLATLDAATKKEMKRKRSSGYAVAALVSAAAQDMYKAESLRNRLQEFERRFPRATDDDKERIMRELERRSHVMRNVTEEMVVAQESIKENLEIEEDVVVRGEVISSDQIETAMLREE